MSLLEFTQPLAALVPRRRSHLRRPGLHRRTTALWDGIAQLVVLLWVQVVLA